MFTYLCKKFKQFIREISNTHTLGFLLPYIFVFNCMHKNLNDPKCSEKPLNKEFKISCQTDGKSPGVYFLFYQMIVKSS
jgi:hypothetical protein